MHKNNKRETPNTKHRRQRGSTSNPSPSSPKPPKARIPDKAYHARRATKSRTPKVRAEAPLDPPKNFVPVMRGALDAPSSPHCLAITSNLEGNSAGVDTVPLDNDRWSLSSDGLMYYDECQPSEKKRNSDRVSGSFKGQIVQAQDSGYCVCQSCQDDQILKYSAMTTVKDRVGMYNPTPASEDLCEGRSSNCFHPTQKLCGSYEQARPRSRETPSQFTQRASQCDITSPSYQDKYTRTSEALEALNNETSKISDTLLPSGLDGKAMPSGSRKQLQLRVGQLETQRMRYASEVEELISQRDGHKPQAEYATRECANGKQGPPYTLQDEQMYEDSNENPVGMAQPLRSSPLMQPHSFSCDKIEYHEKKIWELLDQLEEVQLAKRKIVEHRSILAQQLRNMMHANREHSTRDWDKAQSASEAQVKACEAR